jgi:hypothetical protein
VRRDLEHREDDMGGLERAGPEGGRRRLLGMIAAGAACAGLGLTGRVDAAATAACPADDSATNPLGIRVFRTANPPADNSPSAIAAYAAWPATDLVSSQAVSTTSGWTNGGAANNWPLSAWYFVWANRAADPRQSVLGPNPIQGPAIVDPVTGCECRVNFTSIAKANAATQSLIRYWLGRSDYMAPWLAIAGTSPADFVYYRDLAANPSAFFKSTFKVANAHQNTTYRVMVDRPWLPSAPVTRFNPNGVFQRAYMMRGSAGSRQPPYANAPGVLLDFEVGDGRTPGTGASAKDPEGTLNFLRRLHDDLHAKADSTGQGQIPAQLALFTDALNARSSGAHGLDASNIPLICRNYVDLMPILVSGAGVEKDLQASYFNQLKLLRKLQSDAIPFAKIMAIFDLANSSRSDALFMHDQLRAGVAGPAPNGPASLYVWNNLMTNCASTTTEKLAWLLKGAKA